MMQSNCPNSMDIIVMKPESDITPESENASSQVKDNTVQARIVFKFDKYFLKVKNNSGSARTSSFRIDASCCGDVHLIKEGDTALRYTNSSYRNNGYNSSSSSDSSSGSSSSGSDSSSDSDSDDSSSSSSESSSNSSSSSIDSSSDESHEVISSVTKRQVSSSKDTITTSLSDSSKSTAFTFKPVQDIQFLQSLEALSSNSNRLSIDIQWLNTPTAKELNLPFTEELRFRQRQAMLMHLIGDHLNMTQETVNTSVMYMHIFYMRFSITKYSRMFVATACLLAGGKVTNCRWRLKHLVPGLIQTLSENKFQLYLDANDSITCKMDCELREVMDLLIKDGDNTSSAGYKQFQEMVNKMELTLVNIICHHLIIIHPHGYVLHMSALINASQSREIINYAYGTATLCSQLTMLCLKYKPEMVAAVCLYKASKHYKTTFLSMKDPSLKWYKVLNTQITKKEIIAIYKELLLCIAVCEKYKDWKEHFKTMMDKSSLDHAARIQRVQVRTSLRSQVTQTNSQPTFRTSSAYEQHQQQNKSTLVSSSKPQSSCDTPLTQTQVPPKLETSTTSHLASNSSVPYPDASLETFKNKSQNLASTEHNMTKTSTSEKQSISLDNKPQGNKITISMYKELRENIKTVNKQGVAREKQKDSNPQCSSQATVQPITKAETQQIPEKRHKNDSSSSLSNFKIPKIKMSTSHLTFQVKPDAMSDTPMRNFDEPRLRERSLIADVVCDRKDNEISLNTSINAESIIKRTDSKFGLSNFKIPKLKATSQPNLQVKSDPNKDTLYMKNSELRLKEKLPEAHPLNTASNITSSHILKISSSFPINSKAEMRVNAEQRCQPTPDPPFKNMGPQVGEKPLVYDVVCDKKDHNLNTIINAEQRLKKTDFNSSLSDFKTPNENMPTTRPTLQVKTKPIEDFHLMKNKESVSKFSPKVNSVADKKDNLSASSLYGGNKTETNSHPKVEGSGSILLYKHSYSNSDLHKRDNLSLSHHMDDQESDLKALYQKDDHMLIHSKSDHKSEGRIPNNRSDDLSLHNHNLERGSHKKLHHKEDDLSTSHLEVEGKSHEKTQNASDKLSRPKKICSKKINKHLSADNNTTVSSRIDEDYPSSSHHIVKSHRSDHTFHKLSRRKKTCSKHRKKHKHSQKNDKHLKRQASLSMNEKRAAKMPRLDNSGTDNPKIFITITSSCRFNDYSDSDMSISP